jgi:hypothetical protein
MRWGQKSQGRGSLNKIGGCGRLRRHLPLNSWVGGMLSRQNRVEVSQKISKIKKLDKWIFKF